MIDHLSMIFADIGNRSMRLMPGTFEGFVPNSPRNSTGASGFGSHISMCDGPPRIQRMMTEVILPLVGLTAFALDSERSRFDSDSPMEPRTPAFTKLRRSGCCSVLQNSGQPLRVIDML